MYHAPAFAMDDAEAVHLLGALLAEVPATLVTVGPNGLCSTLLPLTWHPDLGPLGTLHGHVAKGNPVVRQGHEGECLVVVTGAQGYVTPSWYASKAEHGRVVPTWDYLTVEAAGRLSLRPDASWLHDQVVELTDRHEAGRSEPWAVTDAPEDHVAAMLRGIVGIEVAVTRLAAKAKLSQNTSAADRHGVVAGLRAEGTEAAARLADLVDQAARDAPAG